MRQVLVVDDDDLLRKGMRMALEDEGYAVWEASDGKPALERLRATEEGMVVLLDLNMPGVDGQQVLHAVAEDEALATQHTFIVTTALDRKTLPLAFANLLTQLRVDVLPKPFDIDQLLRTVQQAEARLT